MTDDPNHSTRRLEAENSVAAKSPAAQHGDLLSPARVVRDTASSGGGQRLGDGVPVDGPVTSFPDADEEHDERAASDDPPVYG